MRAITLMIFAMATFAIADMCIKIAGRTLPVSQVLTIMGLGGATTCGVIVKLRRLPLVTYDTLHPAILARGCAEIIGTLGFLTALTLIPLSTASAIIQVVPLTVTLGATVFLKESVGWRRWTAIGVGFVGVMIMLAPSGSSTLTIGSLLALVGVLGLTGRDLATRFIPTRVDTIHAAFWGFCAVVLAGFALTLFGGAWVRPTPQETLTLGAMIAFAVAGYMSITSAMRVGDVSAVAPFRYSRIIFAFTLSVLILDEPLSIRTVIGALLVVGAGLYAVFRERIRARTLHPATTSR